MKRKKAAFNPQIERLEDRMLLAVGPQLVGINPNVGSVLGQDDVRNIAPTELVFRFNDGQVIKESTIANGIRITRSGDGVFGNSNDVLITPGYIGRGDSPNEIVVRFNATLPDDFYRIDIFGAGPNALTNAAGEAFNGGVDDHRRFELDLGAQIISVVPQPITRVGGSLVQARDEIVVYFNDDNLNPASAQNKAFYQLIATKDTLTNTDDVVFNPISVVYDATTDSAVLKFSKNIDELAGAGTYRLRIGTDEQRPPVPLEIDGRMERIFDFGTNNAVQVRFLAKATGENAIPPVLHFTKANLGANGAPQVVVNNGQIFVTLNSNSARLTTAQQLVTAINNNANASQLVTASIFSGTGSRNITTPLTGVLHLALVGLGSSYDTASNLGVLGSQGFVVSSAIDPQLFLLNMPGSPNEPGHRDPEITGEGHVDSPDSTPGITRIAYNFKSHYGNAPNGVPLFNLITEAQKQRAREIFSFYSHYLGVEFYETEDEGWTIATGDVRAVNATLGADYDMASNGTDLVVLRSSVVWDDTFGASWFQSAMTGVGHLLGSNFALELPPITSQSDNDDPNTDPDNPPEPVFPGDHDIVHGQYLYRNEANDIDLYRFALNGTGIFTAETFAERLSDSSFLDTVISLYRENQDGSRTLIARNDDYFSEDSFLKMELGPGVYFVGVSASGNTSFDPTVEDSGFGGSSDGAYELKLDFRPRVDSSHFMVDATGVAFDGDHDGTPGGVYDFWFRAQKPADTIIVDKLAPTAGANGSLANPYNNIPAALQAAQPGDIVRIVGNGGTDGNIRTLGDNVAYQIGFNSLNQPLVDGAALEVPKGVTVMIDAGAVFKLQRSRIDVGSSAPHIDRSGGALQVLGTPDTKVYFTSFNDESIGQDTNPTVTQTPKAGDWGGIIFRTDQDRASATPRLDYERLGIFLNYVNNADIAYGGGNVVINSAQQVVNPIHMTDARPTVSHNLIRMSADSAMSANPDSFEESNFHAGQTIRFTSDYDRVGPEIYGNRLESNSINGLFIRIQTPAGNQAHQLTVSARFDDTDIVHVISENLVIRGTAGGPEQDPLTLDLLSRLDARLKIDSGTVVKLNGSRIEVGIGAQLIAEGDAGRPIIFTTLADDRYGAGGTFNTNQSLQLTQERARGQWGGIYVGHTATASFDQVLFAYGGGETSVEGVFTGFNVLEIHQADVRVTNSIFEENAAGSRNNLDSRGGRGFNESATVFVRGAQPILVGNIFRDNAAAAISINANALNHFLVTDTGRMTGAIDLVDAYRDNRGALVRENRLVRNGINGMVIRGATLTTQSVWDDTDIVHVLLETIYVPNLHTYGGLRIQSSPTESLIVKLYGDKAGFTATGDPLDIDDRIGGAVQIIGQAGFPVILTSLKDDSVGAGFQPNGAPQNDTNGDGASTPAPGDWRGIKLDENSNDRNVEVITETEPAGTTTTGSNGTPDNAQYLGALAPNETSGDENRRLGFEVHGVLSRPSDVDVYSFTAQTGTEVWFDIDRTSSSLDTVIELIDANGQVIVRSDNSHFEATGDAELFIAPGIKAFTMPKSPFLGEDHFTTNPKDAGFRVVLPGTNGATSTYHVRVRSSSANLNDLAGGETSGVYQMQLRLRELDEFGGSTVRHAHINYAIKGIEVLGLPRHSPLLGEAIEQVGAHGTRDTAQNLGNALTTDRAVISLAGGIGSREELDWYKFDVRQDSVANGDPYVSVTFDIDYADGLSRANTFLAIFDSTGKLILTSNDSNVIDDQVTSGTTGDLSRGSYGALDPYLGTVELREGTYYVVISSNAQIPQELNQFLDPVPENELVRLEPITAVARIVEDHLDGTPYSTALPPEVQVLFDNQSPVAFHLGDVTLFVSQDQGTKRTRLVTVDPFTGRRETVVSDLDGDGVMEQGEEIPFNIGDIFRRSNGKIYAYSTDLSDNIRSDADAGRYLIISTEDGATDAGEDDGITTYELDENGDPVQANLQADNSRPGFGIHFQAALFTGEAGVEGEYLLAVGNRGGSGPGNNPALERNIVYLMDPESGVASPDRQGEPRATGAATSAIELGFIDTSGGRGGTVTGLARVGGQIYAVCDNGGLYRVDVSLGGGVTTVAVSSPDLQTTRRFSGMTAGPPNVEGGRYANMLFVIDSAGTLYALDTNGRMQPIFQDGAKSIPTGMSDANGLVFSTLDQNLWNITGDRDQDPGHGVNPTPDESRLDPVPGGSSFYFGMDRTPAIDGDHGDYDFPGGAHGSLVSNEFSLRNYSASDQPFLYFNYLLKSSGVDSVLQNGSVTDMFDSARVFVGGEDGKWTLVATNNSFENELYNDEYDYGDDVQKLFDNLDDANNNWRQARISLAQFAGQENLRIRFDFSTAGTMDAGSATTGVELRAVEGSKISQGEILRVGNVNFEFDLGQAPVSAGNTPIVINANMTREQVALAVRRALEAVLVKKELLVSQPSAYTDGQRFTMVDSAGVQATFEFDTNNSVGAGNRRIDLSGLSTPAQVAQAIANAINDPSFNFATVAQASQARITLTRMSQLNTNGIGGLEFTMPDNIFKLDGDLIRVIGPTVNSAGPMGLSTTLEGDEFGNFTSNKRGQDNGFEGFYVDDFIIGLAERGEMVTGAEVNTNYTENDLPRNHNQILTGKYQLEIRPSTSYGIGLFDGERWRLGLFDTFNSNERLVEGFSLQFAGGSQIANGQTFTLGNGVDQITFRFDGEIAEANNTIPTATQTGLAAGVDGTFRGRGVIGEGGNLADVELIAVDLAEGQSLRVDIDAGGSLNSYLRIFNAAGQQVAFNDNGAAPGESANSDSYINFVAPTAGRYYVGVSSVGNTAYNPNVVNAAAGSTSGAYRIEINTGAGKAATSIEYSAGDSPETIVARVLALINGSQVRQLLGLVASSTGNQIHLFGNAVVDMVANAGIDLLTYDQFGDRNRFREQGQVLLHSNRITNSEEFGIVVDAGPRTAENAPTAGPVRNLPELNTERLTTSVFIANNIIAGGGQGGIRFGGDAGTDASVPFGRIVNNTIVGVGGNLLPSSTDATDVGILIEENASPTLLNNIIANFNRGVVVQANGTSVVVNGGTVYQGNDTNVDGTTVGSFALELLNSDILFIEAETGNYYLKANSKAIDSSIEALQERQTFGFLKNGLGIPPSPILAPNLDQTGQLRVDDPSVSTPPGLGQGSNVFKDRGALDRADFTGPAAVLLTPQDNDSAGNDQNSAQTMVVLQNKALTEFAIQLVDGVEPNNPLSGTGVNDSSVNSLKVRITRDGQTLVEGTDYTFAYDTTNNIIRLKPLAGIWVPGHTYVLILDNSIQDLANNPLQANQLTGQTQFTIVLSGGLDFGDAPDSYGTTIENGGANHSTSNLTLGSNVDVENDGQPSADANGDGADENGVTFTTPLRVGTSATIIVNASAAGQLDAWIDWDGDGTFNSSDRIASIAVVAGQNTLVVPVPITAKPGATYARFRLSSQGGLAPTGSAADGEVEDYRVSITGNAWQNPGGPQDGLGRPMDVNGDGVVNPLDVLAIIDELNNPRYSNPVDHTLPTPPSAPNLPPPYLDVNGNGKVDVLDVLPIIDYLNGQTARSRSAGAASRGVATAMVADVSGDSPVGESTVLASAAASAGDSEQGDNKTPVSRAALKSAYYLGAASTAGAPDSETVLYVNQDTEHQSSQTSQQSTPWDDELELLDLRRSELESALSEMASEVEYSSLEHTSPEDELFALL